MKRILYTVLAIALILSALSFSALAAGDDIETGLIPIPGGSTTPITPTLKFDELPTKKVYLVGESLDMTGAVLRYSDSKGETFVTIEPSMISGFDSSAVGKVTVTVTYLGVQATFEVEIVEAPAYLVGDVDGSGSVDSDDAIYLLFNTLFEDDYPITQDADFDKNGDVDSDDAIYLLFHTLFEEDYPLA